MDFDGNEIDLSAVNFTPELLASVPRHIAFHYRALPISKKVDGALGVAVADPRDIDVLDSLTHLLKREIHLRPADRDQLDTFIQRLYGSPSGGDR